MSMPITTAAMRCANCAVMTRPLRATGKAAALAPQRADIRVNEALTLLLTGKLREGFSVYEWRGRAVPDPQAPLWLGAVPLAGRTILIHAEQGFGDTLQFIRYVPLLAA